ncbi:ABC transporter permease [Actinospica sp. MGRD01-02]|uniref:ABC transporter permease n=1 Tax=Actinospica acidithermotolerans TaxID=2828514 RepID=A0A941EBB1_9ACTN|nr:ABC transporter permease [Actinospica acidithermotolerans]MBR7827170.1 ABC transporter permease [Actinospica acidithermotolerans]
MKFASLVKNRKALIGLILFGITVVVSLFPGLFASQSDADVIGAFAPNLGPSTAHLLGTTSYGEDIFSQLVFGARQVLVIALAAGGFATVLSVLIGITAAYLGGVVDEFLSLITNVVLILPTFPLMIILARYAGTSNWVMIFVLVATGWSYGANQMRAQALSLRNRDFLEAARVRGERRAYVILFEMMPTMTSLIVANFLGSALYSVLAASGLQFIGLGNRSSDSWGTMLYWADSQEALQAGNAMWIIAPGLAIAVLSAAFALMNYAFDEIGNPALRPVRRKDVRRAKKGAAALEEKGAGHDAYVEAV